MDRRPINSIVLLVLLGFSLRLYQLGHDSLWNDEAGQALVAAQPTIASVLDGIRLHAMAMPLDYLLSRAANLVSHQEFVLRFPSAMWGTLLIPMFFVLSKRLADRRTAMVAALILTIFPLHLRYSQELRFYASMCFFYIASSFVILEAIKTNQIRHWIIYVLLTKIGSYFHPYVLLSLLNGLGGLLFLKPRLEEFERRLAALFLSGIVVTLLFLPGYTTFGGSQRFNYDLLEIYGSIPNAVLRGIGWIAFPYTPGTPLVGLWELLNIVFAGVGLLTVFSRRWDYPLVLGWLTGAVAQLVLIVAADLYKGYWFLGRQLLHLSLLPILWVAIGTVRCSNVIVERGLVHRKLASLRKSSVAVHTSLVVVVVCAAVPRVMEYYQYEKSGGKRIVMELVKRCEGSERIFVIPAHEEKIYRFYLADMNRHDLIRHLSPTNWNDLENQVAAVEGRWYLAVPGKISEQQRREVSRLGARSVIDLQRPWYGMHALYMGVGR